MTSLDSLPRARRFSRSFAALVAFLLIVAGLWVVYERWGRPGKRAARLLREARASRSAGNLPEAERAAAAALELDPALGEAALLAAECAIADRRFERALAYVEQAKPSARQLQLRTALFAAPLHHHPPHPLSDA